MFSSGVGCIICLPVSFTLSVGWQQSTCRAVCFPSVEVSLEDWFFCRDCGGMSDLLSGRQIEWWWWEVKVPPWFSSISQHLPEFPDCALLLVPHSWCWRYGHEQSWCISFWDNGPAHLSLENSNFGGLYWVWRVGWVAIPSSRGKLLGSWFVLWVCCVTDLFRLFAVLGSYSYLPDVLLGISCQQRTLLRILIIWERKQEQCSHTLLLLTAGDCTALCLTIWQLKQDPGSRERVSSFGENDTVLFSFVLLYFPKPFVVG